MHSSIFFVLSKTHTYPVIHPVRNLEQHREHLERQPQQNDHDQDK